MLIAKDHLQWFHLKHGKIYIWSNDDYHIYRYEYYITEIFNETMTDLMLSWKLECFIFSGLIIFLSFCFFKGLDSCLKMNTVNQLFHTTKQQTQENQDSNLRITFLVMKLECS